MLDIMKNWIMELFYTISATSPSLLADQCPKGNPLIFNNGEPVLTVNCGIKRLSAANYLYATCGSALV